MFLENTSKFLKYYGKGKIFHLSIFFIMSLISGAMELIGVALIYPFIMLIVSPEKVQELSIYHIINAKLAFLNPTMFTLLVGFAIFAVFILKNAFMIILSYYQTRFTTNWKRDITKMIIKYYTFGSYKDLMKTSPGEKLFYATNIIPNVIDGFILRALGIIINVVIVAMIVGFLIIKFPVAAIVTCLFVTTSMILQNKIFKRRTSEIAQRMAPVQSQYSNLLVTNITNIKNVQILSAEKLFYEKYLNSENELRNIQVKQMFYMSIPPYIVESFIILSVLILGVVISIQGGSRSSSLVASFALIAASLFRIAPALNRIQSAIININTTRTFVKKANDEFEKLRPDRLVVNENTKLPDISFEQTIEFKDVRFSYDNTEVLHGVNFVINKGEFIGIVGLSGAGKSTIADILTGLLPINNGKIILDGKILDKKHLASLRKIIGYVPQDPSAFEMSFKDNVTWGCEFCDENRVAEVLKDAGLYEFIVQNYENGINSIPFVGTNGLSQGQKQRLAIARALYRNPDIILLDEATSSLDVVNENEITSVLNNLKGNKTIIAIAHRLSTLKSCSKIIYVKDGIVIDTGTFEELSFKWPDFKTLVDLSQLK